MFIEQPPRLYRDLFQGAYWRVPAAEKCVFLTFDDGPIPEVTPKVLEILAHYQVKATFFCVGDNVARYPEVFRMILDQGHDVGNHTYHHLQGLYCSTDRYLEDVAQAAQLIKSDLFRPPHGHLRLSQLRRLRQNYRIIMWDVVTRDYNKQKCANDIVHVVKRYTRNGSIIVFHDSLRAIGRLEEALPQSIEWLIAEGYSFRLFD